MFAPLGVHAYGTHAVIFPAAGEPKVILHVKPLRTAHETCPTWFYYRRVTHKMIHTIWPILCYSRGQKIKKQFFSVIISVIYRHISIFCYRAVEIFLNLLTKCAIFDISASAIRVTPTKPTKTFSIIALSRQIMLGVIIFLQASTLGRKIRQGCNLNYTKAAHIPFAGGFLWPFPKGAGRNVCGQVACTFSPGASTNI